MSTTPMWNYEEFRTYLLLYAANIDHEFKPEEEAMILQSISKASYDKVKAVYDNTEDDKHLETILEYKGLYFPTSDRTRELLELLVKMFKVDGHFSELEKNCLSLVIDLI